MNDFTKEELLDLLQVYKRFCSTGDPVGLITLEKSILEKLKSMIDNCCEHKWQEIFNERTYSRCQKCGEEGK